MRGRSPRVSLGRHDVSSQQRDVRGGQRQRRSSSSQVAMLARAPTSPIWDAARGSSPHDSSQRSRPWGRRRPRATASTSRVQASRWPRHHQQTTTSRGSWRAASQPVSAAVPSMWSSTCSPRSTRPTFAASSETLGRSLTVTPGPDHLDALRILIYSSVTPHPQTPSIMRGDTLFEQSTSTRVRYPIVLDSPAQIIISWR